MTERSADLPAAIENFLRVRRDRRPEILARIERVNTALTFFDEWEANYQLPAALRRPLPRPSLSRDQLVALHAMLVEELARTTGA